MQAKSLLRLPRQNRKHPTKRKSFYSPNRIPRTRIGWIGVETSEYETIDITVLRRGVIGVNKIGYMPS